VVVLVTTPPPRRIRPGPWITTLSRGIATGPKTIVSIRMVRLWHLATLSRGALARPEFSLGQRFKGLREDL